MVSYRMYAGMKISLIRRNSYDFKTVIDSPAKVEAPIQEGQKIGRVKVYYKDSEVANIDLLAQQAIEKKSLFAAGWNLLWNLFTFVVKNFT